MNLNLLSQYKFSATDIIIEINGAIDAAFIELFVMEYRSLLREKTKKGQSFIIEQRILKFKVLLAEIRDDEDFDLLFISYLVLLREDFPNVTIQIDFTNFLESPAFNAYLFKLAHHRVHLLISCRKEIFRIFRRGVEFIHDKIVQSTSYIPPVFISQDTIGDLFDMKPEDNNYKHILAKVVRSNKNEFTSIAQQKETVYSTLQEIYSNAVGKTEAWSTSDLSMLYLIKALSELFVLRHFINTQLAIKSTYQIGKTITFSGEDRQSSKLFREGVMATLEVNGVFNFSDIECYIFSLVVQNSELFKIPSNLQKMYTQIEKLLTEDEKKKAKNFGNKAADKYLKNKFIELYIVNLTRIINYTKDIAYGLQELAKNIVEHSGPQKESGYGMLTARIYSHDRIKILKNIVPQWLKSYEQKHKFMDINIIDTGLNSVIESYAGTIRKEMESLAILDSPIAVELAEAYSKDLKEMGNYMLNNLFNFDSIKLLHQVNRTKARLGLLIFSQTVLYEKNAFVSLASNSIETDDSVGFYLYKNGKDIVNITNERFLKVGTNYNFTIPIKEIFEKDQEVKARESEKSGASSSVFKELHPYINNPVLKKLDVSLNYVGLDKYSKIEHLRLECNQLASANDILLIDAKELTEVLQNSSDWVRFLASLQFTTDFRKDIIIFNFEVDLYLELINVLRIFDKVGIENKGFWSNERFVLFFLPLSDHNGNTFWFNSLLWSTEYSKFRRINEDISLYHENLSKMAIDESSYDPVDYSNIGSALFSSSKKLLNFELIIRNSNDQTLFEQTLKSLVNIEINDDINED